MKKASLLFTCLFILFGIPLRSQAPKENLVAIVDATVLDGTGAPARWLELDNVKFYR